MTLKSGLAETAVAAMAVELNAETLRRHSSKTAVVSLIFLFRYTIQSINPFIG